MPLYRILIGCIVSILILSEYGMASTTIGTNISTNGTLTIQSNASSAVLIQNAAGTNNIFRFDNENTKFGINYGNAIDTTFEVGGTASISGAITLGGAEILTGTFTGNATGSNSFAGSLTISKGLNANAIQGASLSTCNGSSQKLLYSSGQFSCGTDQGTGAISLAPSSADSDTSTAASIFINDTGGGRLIDLQLSSASRLYATNAGELITFGAVNFAKANAASVSYSRLGTNTTSHSISSAGDLLITGKLEIDDTTYLDGATTINGQTDFSSASGSGNFELTSSTAKLGINAGNNTDTMVEIGGTASASTVQTASYTSRTNCSSSASPAACGSAIAGSFVVAALATSVTVNTTAVTANSQILLTVDSSLGSRLGVTCNTTIPVYRVSSRTAGTSFEVTVTVAPVTDPACFSYLIIN